MAPCPPVEGLRFEEFLLIAGSFIVKLAKERFICGDLLVNKGTSRFRE